MDDSRAGLIKATSPPKPVKAQAPAPDTKPDPEADAARKLKLAKGVLEDNKALGKKRLQEIIDAYPNSKAAEEARELVEKLDK